MNSKLIKWIILFIPLMILIACTLEEPVLPTWLAEWGFPFKSGFTMTEILDDQNFILDSTATGESRIAISISDTSEKKSVSSSDLGIKPDGKTASENIDDLTLGTLGPTGSSTFDITNIIAGPVAPGTVVIPPDMTVQIDLIYLLYDDIKSAHIETGTFRIEFVNNTPFDFDTGTQITIFDDSTDSQVGITDFSQSIPANSSAFADTDIPLDDKVIHNRFRLVITIPIVPGSKDITQDNIDNSTSWINGTLLNLDVLEAEARFPEQHILIEDSSSIMDEEQRIYKADIDNGKVFLTINNNLAATARAKVNILNIIDSSTGEAFTDSIVLLPNSPAQKILEIGNYEITDYPDSNSGNLIDYIYYKIDVVTDSTETYTTISQNDEVVVTVEPDSLFFNRIDGVINDLQIDIDPIEKNDLGDLSKIDGTIFLDSLQMRLNMYNETNLPIDISLVISASNDTREITLAPVNATIPRAEDGGYLQIKLTKNDPSPNIVDLISILPTDIRMEPEAWIDGEGSVEVGQTVQADYQIYSPLFLRIAEPSSIRTDVLEEKINADVRDQIEHKVKTSFFLMNFENGLPISSQAVVYVASDSTKLFDDTIPDDSTKFTISDLEIAAGHIGEDDYVDIPESGQLRIELTEERRKLFYSNELVYIGTKVILDDTGDQLVKFRPEDELKVLGFFKFNFLMNE